MKTLISGQGNRMLATLLSGLLMGMSIMFSTSALAQTTTIVGSAHDFSALGWSQLNGEICVVCHTPHNAVSPTAGPLWNRTLTAVTNYTMYSPNTIPGSDIQGIFGGQPTGVSKLCLSCHDGTIAIDSFGRNTDGTPFTTGTVFVGALNANANIGEGELTGFTGDLSNDHPVAFTFPTAGADNEIVQPIGGVIAAVLPLFGTSNDQMECATCHDVHATGTFAKLLRVDNSAASALCLTCHLK